MFNCFKSEDCLWCVGIGALLGAAVVTVARTAKARELAVQGLAKGMMVKDCVMETVTNIQDGAEDICAEARAVAKEQSDCDDFQCDCGCECDCEPECDCDEAE